MSRQTTSLQQTEEKVEVTVELASPWISALARLGFFAQGIVYLIIGGLALQVAIGVGGSTTDARGAFALVSTEPYGIPVLWAMTAGLVGYSLWRFVQALYDPDGLGKSLFACWRRLGFVGLGLMHLGLAYLAGRFALGMGAGTSTSPDTTTQLFMKLPFGPWIVGLGGAALIGTGLFQAYMAHQKGFRDEMELDKLGPKGRRWLTVSGQIGYTALGVVFALGGIFLVRAAIFLKPTEARGMGEAIHALIEQPSGPYWLGLVAAGLFAFGIFKFIEAYCHRIRMPEPSA